MTSGKQTMKDEPVRKSEWEQLCTANEMLREELSIAESRLAAALHLVPDEVLLGDLRELAKRYRAALEKQ